VPESPTGTWEDDPITLLGLGVLDSTVDSNSLCRVKLVIDWITEDRSG